MEIDLTLNQKVGIVVNRLQGSTELCDLKLAPHKLYQSDIIDIKKGTVYSLDILDNIAKLFEIGRASDLVKLAEKEPTQCL